MIEGIKFKVDGAEIVGILNGRIAEYKAELESLLAKKCDKVTEAANVEHQANRLSAKIVRCEFLAAHVEPDTSFRVTAGELEQLRDSGSEYDPF